MPPHQLALMLIALWAGGVTCLLKDFVDNGGTNRVSKPVDHGAKPIQEPVNWENESHVLYR